MPIPCVVQAAQKGVTVATARYSALRGALSFLGPVMWGAFAVDLALKAIGTDYARVVRAVFLLAQVGDRVGMSLVLAVASHVHGTGARKKLLCHNHHIIGFTIVGLQLRMLAAGLYGKQRCATCNTHAGWCCVMWSLQVRLVRTRGFVNPTEVAIERPANWNMCTPTSDDDDVFSDPGGAC